MCDFGRVAHNITFIISYLPLHPSTKKNNISTNSLLTGSTNLWYNLSRSPNKANERTNPMANAPSIYKQKVSLQLDNEVIVALDKKAEEDKTSRNAVANYLLTDKLEAIIKAFTPADKARVANMEKKNKEARNAR